MRRCLLLVALAVVLVASSYGDDTIVVSAAASLTDVLNGLKPAAEQATGAKLLYNFGASGTLRRQIEQGAPVDVFFSAASEDMDGLEKGGLVVSATRRDLLSNSVVLVGDKTLPAPASGSDLRALLARANLLAIGDPDAVPAGRYAVQVLKSLGLYSTVEKKLVLGENVRVVLQYVESGSAPLGVVFRTDALTLKPGSTAGVLYRFPDDALQTPIRYPAAVLSSSKLPDKAALFLDFLGTPVAQTAFRAAGFGTP